MTGGSAERPLRIALLHAFDPAEVRRGTERLVEELMLGLRESGHSVTLITARSGPRTQETRQGVRVVLNRRPPAPGPVARHALAHVPAARRALGRGDFDVAHAFHPSDALAAIGWGRRPNVPVVFTVPAFPPAAAGAVRRRVLARVFSRAAAVVVPTAAVEEAVGRVHPGARTETVAPGVDTDSFTPGGERSPTPTVFCAADPAEARKRVRMLTEALGIARKDVPAAKLVVADPYAGLRQPAAWLEGEGVELRPIRNDEDLRGAYREAWVSALPAHDEPFGLVLTESMACGTPVLGAAHGGIPEVIGDGPQGRLVEGGEGEWGRALAAALSGPPDETAATAARQRAEEFSMRRCLAGYEALYRRLAQA